MPFKGWYTGGKDHQRRAEFTCTWGQNQKTYPETVTRKKIRAA